jgi:hypothetical protein
MVKGIIKDDWLIPVGSICLAAAILSDRFIPVEAAILDFVIGVLTGLALILNLVGLYRMRSLREQGYDLPTV